MSAKPLEKLNTPSGDAIEQSLRPSRLTDFTGQPKLKDRLGILIDSARARSQPLDHLLLSGPPGLGKTTLAHILGAEMNATVRTTSGPAIEKAGDLAGLLTGLQEGDILFIDEIHRLSKVIEEYLYPAVEDFRIDIVIDQGPAARSVRLNLPRFTLIGATTRAGLLSAPLRSRFGVAHRLDYYSVEDLTTIVQRSASLLEVKLEPQAAPEIARRCRGTHASQTTSSAGFVITRSPVPKGPPPLLPRLPPSRCLRSINTVWTKWINVSSKPSRANGREDLRDSTP